MSSNLPITTLQADAAKAAGFAREARSANTRRAYRSDWKDFTSWCQNRDLTAMPAEVATVALYVASRSETLKVATLERRLASIGQAHKAAGFDSPTSTHAEPLHSVWRGLVRTKSRRKKKAEALLIEDLRAIVTALPTCNNGNSAPEPTLRSKRDRALLLVGWAGALRRSELTNLTVSDLAFGPDGLVIHLPHSKTDQQGEGHVVGIPHGEHPATCPLRALQSWLEAAQIYSGPIFRAIDRWDNISPAALSPDGAHRIIKSSCARVGLDERLYSGHSVRAGFITQAVRAGKQERVIMRHSRHIDLKTFREYVRDGGLFRDNAVQGVGL